MSDDHQTGRQAFGSLNSSIQKEESLQQLVNRGRSQLRLGKLAEGLETYFKAATEMVLIGKLGKAAAVYKLILKAAPGNSLALTLLASLYHNQGLAEEARQLEQDHRRSNPEQESDQLRILGKALHPLFDFSETDQLARLKQIAGLFQIKNFAPDLVLLHEGESNQTLYVILEELVEVYCKGSDENTKLPIITLASGSFFGEFSLLTGEAANASIRTLARSWIATLTRCDLDRLAVHFPELLTRMIHVYRSRKQDLLQKRIAHLAPTKACSAPVFAETTGTEK
ncbi:MAG TPA: cyclic nucleotide-binding domain-containing protein [Proteobacteria bacterium]|nr:cyclic nucleotide-binding domain-containing protein [Pseudomonadota bacterium]